MLRLPALLSWKFRPEGRREVHYLWADCGSSFSSNKYPQNVIAVTSHSRPTHPHTHGCVHKHILAWLNLTWIELQDDRTIRCQIQRHNRKGERNTTKEPNLNRREETKEQFECQYSHMHILRPSYMLVCMVVMTSHLTSETHISNGVQCHVSPNVLSFWHKIGSSHTSRQTT